MLTASLRGILWMLTRRLLWGVESDRQRRFSMLVFRIIVEGPAQCTGDRRLRSYSPALLNIFAKEEQS